MENGPAHANLPSSVFPREVFPVDLPRGFFLVTNAAGDGRDPEGD